MKTIIDYIRSIFTIPYAEWLYQDDNLPLDTDFCDVDDWPLDDRQTDSLID